MLILLPQDCACLDAGVLYCRSIYLIEETLWNAFFCQNHLVRFAKWQNQIALSNWILCFLLHLCCLVFLLYDGGLVVKDLLLF